MSGAVGRRDGVTVRPWLMLAVSVAAQASASVAINGPAFLIPTLHTDRGLSLVASGTLAVMPVAGVMTTLFLWGLVVDRIGERFVLLAGLAGSTLFGAVSTITDRPLTLGAALFLMGTFAASTASASGRIVIGWFPTERRGLAMGVRQMAQPLGVAVAAATIAVIAERHGVSTALWVPTVATAVAGVLVLLVVVDPPRPRATADLTRNPYVTSDFLWRIHGVSVLLVVPQFLVWTYALTWLVADRGWEAGPAGLVVAATHVLGAVGRIWVGHLSDVVGSRVRPLRWVTIAAAGSMALLAVLEPSPVAVLLMVLASAITVADNGLAFTSVAEHAGAFWSGRALGIQNTAQYAAATATAPLAGLAITHWGYAATFGVVAVFPLAAIALVPSTVSHDELGSRAIR